MAASDVTNTLRQATSSDRIRVVLGDGNEAEAVIEESDYTPATTTPRGYVDPGSLYVSLIETDEIEEAYDLPYGADSLVEIHATETAPDEWSSPTIGFEDLYSESDREHWNLGEVVELERID